MVNAGHLQEIGNPQSVEKVTSADLFLTMVLTEVNELEHVRVPWLKIDGEGTGSLVASLVNVTSSCIVCTEHGHNTVRETVRTGNVRSILGIMRRHRENIARYVPSSTNVVDVEANTSGSLTDHGTVLQSVIDALYGVVLHAYQETRAELRMRGAGVEEGR